MLQRGNVKLAPCTPRKRTEGVKVWFHTFLTTALDGVTHLPLLTPGGMTPGSKNSNLECGAEFR